MRARQLVVSALVLLAVACAGSRSSGGGRNPNLITAGEIEQHRSAGVRDLYELIERARPRWLQIRTERSLQLPTVVLVYHNNSRVGGIETLRNYLLSTPIASVRYLDAAQAGLLPGAGSAHVEGAIVISTDVR